MALRAAVTPSKEPYLLKVLIVQTDQRQLVGFFEHRFGHKLNVLVHIELNADQALNRLVLVPKPIQ